MKKMNVMLQTVDPFSAIQTYRQFTPLEVCVSPDFQVISDNIKHDFKNAMRPKAMAMMDMVHVHTALGIQIYRLDTLKKMIGAPPSIYKDDEGQYAMKYPPAFVWDVDDKYDDVSAYNPSYHMWGVKRPDGTPLQIGDSVMIPRDDGGEPIARWVDGAADDRGHIAFDVAGNHTRLATLEEILKITTMVTASTPNLQKYLSSLLSREVVLVPNLIRRTDYPTVELGGHPSEVRILWQGGYGHFEDLYEIKDTLARVLRENPNAKFLMFGERFQRVLNDLPEGQWEHVPWVPVEAYYTRLSTINHDINLTPVVDNDFNSCKSAIKFYESSAICKPAATLAAKVGHYEQEIIDGETGLLYSNQEGFYQGLTRLVKDSELRGRIAAQAHEWVWRERDVEKFRDQLLATWHDAVARAARNTEELHCVVP